MWYTGAYQGVGTCPKHYGNYRIVGNFRGRNFHKFQGSRAIHESFLHEIFRYAAPTYVWFQAISESFLREILSSYRSAKSFSLESLSLYGIQVYIHYDTLASTR